MQKIEVPQVSPLPTAAPHLGEVFWRLLVARQAGDVGALGPTCGWTNANVSQPITCPSDFVCAHSADEAAFGCCSSSIYPNCHQFYTTCLASTDVATNCNSDCLSNTAVLKCTSNTRTSCVQQLLDLSSASTFVTGYDCEEIGNTVTVYDHTLGGNGTSPTTTTVSPTTAPTTTTPFPGPTPPSPTPTTPTPTPAPSSGGGLSGGAIAGIAIGAIAGFAIIVGLLLLLFIQRRRQQRLEERVSQQQPPPPMTQAPPTNPQPPIGGGGGAGTTDPHTSYLSQPSQASSSVPLTGSNLAAMSQQHQPQSEIGPMDSASNIGGPQGSSVVQQNSNPAGTSPEHSGVGALPPSGAPQYPTGAAAFPHAAPSTVGPGSAFGSMPPGHAPSAV